MLGCWVLAHLGAVPVQTARCSRRLFGFRPKLDTYHCTRRRQVTFEAPTERSSSRAPFPLGRRRRNRGRWGLCRTAGSVSG